MDKQPVIFTDLGIIEYKQAWDYQEMLLFDNVKIKSTARDQDVFSSSKDIPTQHHLIFCEHPPVYTLGKSGNPENVLLSIQDLQQKGIAFFNTNRGGDVTFHGPDQIVGYPILDLEKFKTDIGLYLRNIEEVIIRTLAEYDIIGERSAGETGVWIDSTILHKARKICAIGVRCSRWITMHGFALNVNTDLQYFNNIVPCGIQNKKVTSLEKEIGYKANMEHVKHQLRHHFEEVFEVILQ